MNSLELVTIYAFLEALTQQTEPLPPDLKHQINEVGHLFTNNPTAAANRLLKLAEHETIKPIYEQIRLEIQRQYEPEELNRWMSFDEPNSSDEPQPETLENLMAVSLQSSEPEKDAQKLLSKLKSLFPRLYRQKNND
ncbi:hypothetical protein [Coleofasciculus chthonoplastes]|uniref:hypothetical protein n=1 Tax=Coleofasciculus chthonoplastes TaxID=64178 RepID=UPI0002DE168F|nr:hypothetical protein [Coleofasciculus chthonoplastes]